MQVGKGVCLDIRSNWPMNTAAMINLCPAKSGHILEPTNPSTPITGDCARLVPVPRAEDATLPPASRRYRAPPIPQPLGRAPDRSERPIKWEEWGPLPPLVAPRSRAALWGSHSASRVASRDRHLAGRRTSDGAGCGCTKSCGGIFPPA
ncbi:hypothetical protein GQ53DRAFT_342203 [Thozetella sp. PMI_491]|nr:hypothetical protein GQ53DRAFT_342203 [Thozetella sp. PMI_491]